MAYENPHLNRQNPYLSQENPYLNQSNPGLQGQIDLAQQDVVRNYNLSTQPAYNNAMVKSGSFGNTGVQQMNENAQRNMQGSLGDISQQMRFNDWTNQQNMYKWDTQNKGDMYKWDTENQGNMYKWDQEFDRNIFNDAFGQNQSNLGLGMGLLNTLNGYNQQDLNNATTIQNTPQTYYNQFANSANAVAGQGQTNTSTVGTSSSPWTAALGGAQLGSSLYDSWSNKRFGTSGSGGSGNTDWVGGSGAYGAGGGDYYGAAGGDYGQFF